MPYEATSTVTKRPARAQSGNRTHTGAQRPWGKYEAAQGSPSAGRSYDG
jgi:hypothetical protein